MGLVKAALDSETACVRLGGAIKCRCGDAWAAVNAAVDALVAERDALRTERDTLRQVIEQQLLNVPAEEWKK